MSAGEATIDQPPYKGTYYANAHGLSDCLPEARVIIERPDYGEGVGTISISTEVPTVNDDETPAVEVQMRKTGVSDLTKASEVNIPYEWGGYDVFGQIVGQSGDKGRSFHRIRGMPVRVELLDDTSGSYVIAHHGPVLNAGPSSIDGAFRLSIGDWANYFERVGINFEFAGNSIADLMQTVQSQVNEHEGTYPTGFGVVTVDGTKELDPDAESTFFVDEVGTGNLGELWGSAQFLFITLGKEVGKALDGLVPGFDPTWGGAETKTEFVDHKDSAKTVMDWVTNRATASWRVGYAPKQTGQERPVIIIDPTFSGPHLTGYSLNSELDTTNAVKLLKNNALFQISPQHTFGAIGERGPKTKGKPKVRVHHEGLVERSGENPNPLYRDIDAKGKTSTISIAKQKLKTIIDDAAGGQMVTTLAPMATPYGTIEAQPTCNGRLDYDMNPITYEIEEVIHEVKRPTVSEDQHSQTILRCGVEAKMDDIVVAEYSNVST